MLLNGQHGDKPGAERRVNNLDFLRFFLASCVAFTHSYNLLYGESTDPLGVATDGAVGLAGEAVNFFFILSGYLISKSWVQSAGFADFLKKRVLRIYPAFIVVVLLCVFVVGPLGAADTAAYFDALKIRHLIPDIIRLKLMGLPPTFEHNAFPNNVNGSLWTINSEFLCYLLVAILGMLKWSRGKYHKPIVITLFFCSLCAYVLQSLDAELPLLGSLAGLGSGPRFLASFSAGMILFLFDERIPYSRMLFAIALTLFVVLAFFLGLVALATPLFGSYCVLYLAFNQKLGLQRFGKHGDFSYGIYLYAFPIQQLLALYAGHALTGLGMFAVSMLASLACAVLSWHLIEQPCLKLKKRTAAP